MKKLLLLFFAFLCFLVSCEELGIPTPDIPDVPIVDIPVEPKDSVEVVFSANINNFVADFGLENTAIAILADAPINSGIVKYIFKDNSLTSEHPIFWNKAQTEKNDFYFIYPYDIAIRASSFIQQKEFSFSVSTDQSTLERYKETDLMMSRSSGKPADEKVHFEVVHLLSQVYIQIENKTNVEIERVSLSGVFTGVTVNSELSVQAENKQETIQAFELDKGPAWVLVIPPQTVQPQLLIGTSDGKQINYTLPEELTFLSAGSTTVNLTIEEEKEEISCAGFSATISDWISDAEFNINIKV